MTATVVVGLFVIGLFILVIGMKMIRSDSRVAESDARGSYTSSSGAFKGLKPMNANESRGLAAANRNDW